MGGEITVGVPCYNSERTVSSVLESLGQQTRDPNYVVCVDDGSQDGTLDIIKSYPRVELIEHDQNKGLGSARNTILKHTNTEYLAMIDDDIRPAEKWLSTLLETLTETDAALVSAAIEEQISHRADRWRALRTGANPYDEAGPVPQVAGGNFLGRTETFRSAGGWPDGHWNSEDMVFCQKLQEQGQSIYYEPSTKVTHLESDTPRSVLRRLWRWHLNDPDDVSSPIDVLVRSPLHFVKAAYYTAEDVVNRRWWAVPITVRLPLEFIRNDSDHVF